MNRAAESAVVGASAATLAGFFGSRIGIGPVAAAVGALNGAVAGWRRVYHWRSRRGVLAFVLDSTWALATTSAAVAVHAFAAVRRDRSFQPAFSERKNRFVYGNGLRFRRGFAITFGNTVCGVGNLDRSAASRLVTDHEDVHVWQARWFGPLFPVLYGVWMIGAGVLGGAAWVAGLRRAGLAQTVESFAYYMNPFEWWAYSRDDNWPPSGLAAGLGPRRAMVRSFRARRDRAV